MLRRHRITVLCLTLSVAVEALGAIKMPDVPVTEELEWQSSQNLSATPLRLQLERWDALPIQQEPDAGPSLFRPGTLYAGKSDLSGLKRDTPYFFGLQVSILGLLYLAPEGTSNWSKEQVDEFGIGSWLDNVQDVKWDNDNWWINYILHPYWGATYYTRARERNLDRTQAFWYSTLLSSLWELGGEALFEEPSIQDLIVTPVAGTIVGFWFEDVRNSIRAKGEAASTTDKLILTVTDPIGAAARYADKLLGIDNLDLQLGLVPRSNSRMLIVKIRW